VYFERGKSLASPDGLTGGKPRRWGQQTYVKERDFSIPAKKRKKREHNPFLENYLSVFLHSYEMHLSADATTHYKCAKHCALLSKHELRFFGQIISQYISGHFLIQNKQYKDKIIKHLGIEFFFECSM